MHDNSQKSGLLEVRILPFPPAKAKCTRRPKIEGIVFKKGLLYAKNTNDKQTKGFHLAEWLLRPGTLVCAGGFSSLPLYATNIAYN